MELFETFPCFDPNSYWINLFLPYLKECFSLIEEMDLFDTRGVVKIFPFEENANFYAEEIPIISFIRTN